MIRVALRHAFAEAWSIARSGPGLTVLAVGLITLALYIPGLLLLLTQNVSRLATNVEVPPSFVATLSPDSDARSVANAIAAEPEVVRVRIVRPAAARDHFLATFPDLRPALVRLPDLEFPTALEVVLSPSSLNSSTRLAAKARRLPGVEQVQEEAAFEARFREAVSVVKRFAYLLGAGLCLAGIFSVASAVRLALDQHRDEVEIMRLMGATEAKIRAPFWLHGALEGAAGGSLALVLLVVTYVVATRFLQGAPHPILSIFWVRFFSPAALAVFPAAGAAAGLLGAALSVREGVV
ncbi:MAG: cell division protein FtsX [Thermoanaerobaculia bacterium]